MLLPLLIDLGMFGPFVPPAAPDPCDWFSAPAAPDWAAAPAPPDWFTPKEC